MHRWIAVVAFAFAACRRGSSEETAALRARLREVELRLRACERSALSPDQISGVRPTVTAGGPSASTLGDSGNASIDQLIAAGARPPRHAWRYVRRLDEMRNAESLGACLQASNTLEFAFPYDGGSSASLCFRQSPRSGFGAYVVVSRGQFNCGLDRCELHVRFDDSPVQPLRASPAERSSNTIFLANPRQVLDAIQRARRLILEAEFHSEGARQIRFDDVTGLVWPPPAQVDAGP